MEKLDFAAFLKTLPKPVFFPCERCGELTNKSPCWECTQKSLRDGTKRERRQALEYTIPDGYEHVQLTAAALDGYVKDTRNLSTLVEQGYTQARREKSCCIFLGPAGAGKTTLAIAMLRAWQDLHNKSAMLLKAYSLSGEQFKLDDEWIRIGLLYIDDLGAEPPMSNNLAGHLIYARHADNKPTWISTGLTRDELRRRYGDGIFRRMFEMSYAFDMVKP